MTGRLAGGALLGLYRPGRTLLHRLPAGAKLLGLLVFGVVAVVLSGPWTAVAVLAAAAALAAWSGMGLRVLLHTLRGLLLIAVLLGAFQAWQRGWPAAVESVADLVALVLAATVLTATTPLDALLDTLTRLLRPARRVGVDPELVALACSLMIRAVPMTLDLAGQTRQAAVARGLQRNPRALVTPMVVRVAAQARATGEALQARGIGDRD
ncbi:energy-coupling factor transporter transmembrane component T family protein [Nakamurella leprariae]|uniref:Energy-coupling factor transporter transmembrane protein EcfT n=1 Tax=Nakamurella leprariae TaxID=2803911 RepID=A0A939BXI5_9ACTN|nr:energy-coupling factor transporter transmembrane protein EcfT [Nakamurella leprariae]MBM9468593.1 energy-coupling factor transporter transmembrane protein EcfT [Nakamurella leprariae]